MITREQWEQYQQGNFAGFEFLSLHKSVRVLHVIQSGESWQCEIQSSEDTHVEAFTTKTLRKVADEMLQEQAFEWIQERADNDALRLEVDTLHKLIERTYDAVFPTGNNLMGYASKLDMIARQVQKLYKGPSVLAIKNRVGLLVERGILKGPQNFDIFISALAGYELLIITMSKRDGFPYWEDSDDPE